MKINSKDIKYTSEILMLVSQIDNFHGKWDSINKVSPARIANLQRIASIESVGASTRIEGSSLSDKEIENLLGNINIQQFQSRDEEEVIGYFETLDTISESWQEIKFKEPYIKQLHSMLLKHSIKDQHHKGSYKTTENNVGAFQDGKLQAIIFETSSPFDTPIHMQNLMKWTNTQLETEELHSLIIIGIFIVVFLAIHPFSDGNGRLSRLLTTYLMLKCGYSYVLYESLEKIIESNKKAYYQALRKTQKTLKKEKPDYSTWLIFFLKIIRKHQKSLESKLEEINIMDKEISPLSRAILELAKKHQQISASDIRNVTNANKSTIKLHIQNLVKKGMLVKHGEKKGTWYSIN